MQSSEMLFCLGKDGRPNALGFPINNALLQEDIGCKELASGKWGIPAGLASFNRVQDLMTTVAPKCTSSGLVPPRLMEALENLAVQQKTEAKRTTRKVSKRAKGTRRRVRNKS